jgi:hypothetical protein
LAGSKSKINHYPIAGPVAIVAHCSDRTLGRRVGPLPSELNAHTRGATADGAEGFENNKSTIAKKYLTGPETHLKETSGSPTTMARNRASIA